MNKEQTKFFFKGEEVKIKNPGTKGMKDFLIISKALRKMPKEQDENTSFLDYFDDKTMDSAVNLVNLSMENTFEKVTPEIDQWAASMFVPLLDHISEICVPQENDYQNEKIDELKKRLQK